MEVHAPDCRQGEGFNHGVPTPRCHFNGCRMARQQDITAAALAATAAEQQESLLSQRIQEVGGSFCLTDALACLCSRRALTTGEEAWQASVRGWGGGGGGGRRLSAPSSARASAGQDLLRP